LLPTAIKGQYFYWYMVLDVFSRKIVGQEVHVTESSELAALLMRRSSLADQLGVAPSFSRPRVSSDDPYAESLFRTCKYRPGYPCKPLATVEDARFWATQFVRWYIHQHKHSGLKFITPAQRHDGKTSAILTQCDQVYAAAKMRTLERWSGATRNWVLKDEVWLNPERNHPESIKEIV
jgi:putative transposase